MEIFIFPLKNEEISGKDKKNSKKYSLISVKIN